MSIMPSMSFSFVWVSDASGMTTFRPIIPLRPARASRGQFQSCLIDTGNPNTYLDWRLTPIAGVNLDQADKIDHNSWSVGGVPADGLWGTTLALLIEDDRYMIRLGDVPVIFMKPWLNPDFTMVLGTNGMRRIGILVDAGLNNGQLTVSQR
jgi:hypothetical protein